MQVKSHMPYEDAWRDYRRIRLIFWAVFISYVPGASFIGILLQKLFNSEIPVYFVAATWMVAFLVSGLRLTFWKCPRCGDFFFAKWWGVNQLRRKCVHCGLPKWAQADPPLKIDT